jgi:hypothetical protein
MGVLGNNVLPCRTVMMWAAGFQRERATSGNLEHPGSPVSVRNNVSRAVTDQCIGSDRRWTLLELQAAIGIEKHIIHKVLREDLHLCKIEIAPYTQ